MQSHGVKALNYSDYYNLLGLAPDADWQQFRNAYRKRAQYWHPDRYNEEQDSARSELANVRFRELTEAHAALQKYYEQYNKLPFEEVLKDSANNAFETTQQQPQQNTAPSERTHHGSRHTPVSILSNRASALIAALFFIVVTVIVAILMDQKQHTNTADNIASGEQGSSWQSQLKKDIITHPLGNN